MSYLQTRIKSIVRHLMSVRGVLVAFAGLASLASVLASDRVSEVLTLIALAAAGLLILLMSLRQADDHAVISDLRRRRTALESDRKTATPAAAPTKAVHRVGPNRHTQRVERIDQARAKIIAVRGTLALADVVVHAPDRPLGSSTPGSPVVSIVVPCYNESTFLGATLESVRRQSFTDWECLIVDDASTDRSVAEARRFTKVDDRFRLVRHKANGGLSAARNTGLRMARGTYVTFLDSDDMLMADSLLDRLEAYADATPATAGTFCAVKLVPEDTVLDSLPPHESWPDPWFVDFVSAGGECPFNAHAPLLRTAVARRVGGFDESMRDGAEDWDLWLRILRRGYNFIPSKWRTAVYRQKHRSMAKDGAKGHVRAAQQLVSLAYSNDQNAAFDPLAPRPFPEPLPVYQEQLVHARRALQYAATSLASGDEAAAHAIINESDVRIEPWMDMHLGFDTVINAGFRRALGLQSSEVEELSEELEPLNSKLHALIAGPTPEVTTTAPTAPFPNQWDTLLLPQNAVQAREMLTVAEGLPVGTFAFLNMERVSGVQGVGAILSKVPHHPAFSLNEWILHHHKHRRLVVAFPRDGAAEELVAATITNGGEVVELALPTDEIMRVDESPDYGHNILRLPGDGVRDWLQSESVTSFVSAANSQAGALLWFGATDPDPDDAYVVDEYPDTFFDAAAMERFKDIHQGERCVIIGNGPSLNKLDLRKLRNEYTIGVNGIFYAADQMGYDLSYYVVEDTMVMKDNVDAIKAYPAGHKFFPSIYRDQVGEAPNVTYFMMNRGYYAPNSPSFCVPRFSTDASQRVYSGQSVTIINLQLAYYMGFSEVVLIGMDFSYTVPPDSQINGAHILSMGDDPNHFHPDYFGKGKVWKDPKLDRVLANYQLAKLMYEADGRRIVNATPGGRLELFDRVPYDELFD
jgi:hypothetical protein